MNVTESKAKVTTFQQITIDMKTVVAVIVSAVTFAVVAIVSFFNILDSKIPAPQVLIRLDNLETNQKEMKTEVKDVERELNILRRKASGTP